MTQTTEKRGTEYPFKAEIRQLLDILIHSVYTAKDVFVRELVSNAADALEKLRFTKVRGGDVFEPERSEEIRIETREEDGRKILVVSDTGVGMTEEEVRTNLGTIAHSGAAAFLESLKKEGTGAAGGAKPDVSLIGRFGVGFYSVFMAADKVVVTSRSADRDAAAVVWTSDGQGSFEVAEAGGDVPRGTRVEVWLKKDEERFADLATVRRAIRKYSNFVPFPIYVGGEQVNRITALWREPPSQVKEGQYREFFDYLTYEGNEFIAKLHLSVDVPLQFSALLFVPKAHPEAFGFGEREVRLQLYVKRVLIDGENKDLLPKYLRFTTGVVESEDLPLNISRETLQENAIVFKIRETLARKLLDALLELAKERPDDYAAFWKGSGRILKEGHADFPNRERWVELLRFNSSANADSDGLRSLAEYVEAMPEGQKAIYYLSGPSRAALERDPRLEIFRKHKVEVLYLHDLADEFVLGELATYKEKPLVCADQARPADLAELRREPASAGGSEGAGARDAAAGSAAEAESTAEIGRLVSRCREVLGDRVIDVRASERLVDSPCCLVAEEGASGHIDKVLRLLRDDRELPKRIFELNPRNQLVRSLAELAARDAADPFVARACEQLFEGAMLADGFLADPHRLVERMNAILEDAAALKAAPGSTSTTESRAAGAPTR